MSRRRRVVLCPCGQPARRINHAKFCSRCWQRQGAPKRACLSCGEEFSADVMQGQKCRPCVSSAAHGKRIVETYGLSAEMYAELLAFQGGACFVCRRKPGAKRLHVDHDHTTGAVRGLLDKACNRDILGHLRDDVDALHRAISYLEEPPAKRLWPGRDVRPDVTRQQKGQS